MDGNKIVVRLKTFTIGDRYLIMTTELTVFLNNKHKFILVQSLYHNKIYGTK